MKFIFKRY